MSVILGVLLAQLAGAPPTAPIDPYLPPSLRATVADASAAELDPKRGANNALGILERAKDGAAPGAEAQALDLRIAATSLRSRFLTAEQFPRSRRYEQALSTFARLDLAEPGLAAWLDRTLAESPATAKKLGKRAGWTVEVGLLTRSASLDRKRVEKAFTDAFAAAGVKLRFVPAKDARLVITAGAEDVPRPSEGDSAVKLTIGLESVKDGAVVWRGGFFRVTAAKDPRLALEGALEWSARIGGRDLFFRWLGEHGMETMLELGPRRPGPVADHDHNHGHE